jgi:hypothetical protein
MDDFGDHFFGEAFWSHFLRDFSEFGRPWGSAWESVGTTLAHVWSLLFEINFSAIFDAILGRAGGMGGGLLNLRICRTWDDLNHAATPAGVRRISRELRSAAALMGLCTVRWQAQGSGSVC